MTEIVSNRPVVVMKFGGTSVADAAGRDALARRVAAALELEHMPVVVVSAMGRAGAPYATDTLLGLVEGMPSNAAEQDLLSSVGELVSAVVVAHELRAAGIEARAFSGADAGISTDGVAGNAAVTSVDVSRLRGALSTGVVPVVAGFQGVGADGSLTTLGRGGSDTTACALGVALGAVEVEIYTDVDGVMSADPRVCGDSEVLEVIGADELFQLARSGSRIVHTPAAELALNSGIPVRVRNTFSQHDGTLVTGVADIAGYRPDRVATAVSHTSNVVQFRVSLLAPEGSTDHMRTQTQVYRAMAQARVSLDMFTPLGDRMIFTVAEASLEDARAVLEKLELTHEVIDGLSKVTLVGAGMHGVPGVMARLAEYLEAAGVDIRQSADSHTTISVLIPTGDTATAIHALHEGFELGE